MLEGATDCTRVFYWFQINMPGISTLFPRGEPLSLFESPPMVIRDHLDLSGCPTNPQQLGARLRWKDPVDFLVGQPTCIHCGAEEAGVEHPWWGCAKIPRTTLPNVDVSFDTLLNLRRTAAWPKCFWRTSIVPRGVVARDYSPFIFRPLLLHPPGTNRTHFPTTAFTGGSGCKVTQVARASIG